MILYVFMAVLLVIAIALLYIWYSPKPAVWLLRQGGDGPVTVPAGYEEQVREVQVQKNLTYPSKNDQNQFDLYLPGKKDKAPLILWVHGGAFVAGDKRGTENWGKLLASEGYAVASMNYEWAPEAVWPAQVNQVTECLQELYRLSENGLPLDMDRVFLAGDSAGAHIAMQAATAWISEAFSEETGIQPPTGRDKNVLKGILLYCGPYDVESFAKLEDKKLRFFMDKIGQSYLGRHDWKDSENVKYLNIASWVTGDCPPVYITDGNTGSFEEQGKRLGSTLKSIGVPVWERYFSKEQGEIPHEYQMELAKPQGAACYGDTLEFLERYSKTAGKEMER